MHTVNMGEPGRVFKMSDLPGEELGKSYYGVECTQCREQVGVLEDPLKSKSVKFFGDGVWRITCPYCSEQGDYGVASIIYFDVPPLP